MECGGISVDLSVVTALFKVNVQTCRGRYRISRKRGRGVSRVWIFHTWKFCSGTYHVVHGQHTGVKTPVKIARGDKTLAILWNREAKMPILSKHFIYDTDDQVN